MVLRVAVAISLGVAVWSSPDARLTVCPGQSDRPPLLRFPEQTRQRIEQAMNRLQTSGELEQILARWQ